MSEKRKDNKGRILRNGETQRSDGMYMYRYNDAGGVRRTIYSWRLVETGKTPPRKKSCEPLRELEKQLTRDTEDGIQSFIAAKKTVNDFYNKYMELKKELKQTTKSSYRNVYESYVESDLGKRVIGSVKYSDIKNFYLSLFYDKKLSPNTIHSVNTILHPIFTLAVRDGYIRVNPAYRVYAELKQQYGWSQDKRHALTEAQQTAFMQFISETKKYNKWVNMFTVFLGTGCRVGELTGLCWEDCDFTENTISINHNLVYCRSEKGAKNEFHINIPKTKAGKRIIPMMKAVRKAILSERLKQMQIGFSDYSVDGYSGFVFCNSAGKPFAATYINQVINNIIADYNEKETKKAKRKRREPELLPHFSVHNLRHTFCTRFCENETNLKVIQEIMGHSNISTTMDVYNEATQEQKKISLANLESKIKIG